MISKVHAISYLTDWELPNWYIKKYLQKYFLKRWNTGYLRNQLTEQGSSVMLRYENVNYKVASHGILDTSKDQVFISFRVPVEGIPVALISTNKSK